MKEKFNKFKEFYKKHRSKFSFGITIIVCLIIAKLITVFIFTSSLVVGNSMSPTLENGDKGISDALFFKMGTLKRFDIVIVETSNGELLVKRIIALPNEHIYYANGVLKIDGEVVEEKFISNSVAKKTGPIDRTLGEDSYFVMGDNRGNSSDSRGVLGLVPYSSIKARGIMIFSKCKKVENGSCSGLKLVWPYFR